MSTADVAVQNTTPAQQRTKEINMKENIHSINYGFCEIQRNSSIVFLRTV